MKLVWIDIDKPEIKENLDPAKSGFAQEERTGYCIALEQDCKPFPTCQTCDKWKTKKCIISRLCEDMLRNSNRDISKGIYPDHDFCCTYHPEFNQS